MITGVANSSNVDMKILFITHDASRTGAPIVLLHFLKWLRDHTATTFETVCLAGGEMLGKFEEVGAVHVVGDERSGVRRLRKLLRVKLERLDRLSVLAAKLTGNRYDLIYANTIASVRAAVVLSRSDMGSPKIIAHIHEGMLAANRFAPDFLDYAQDVHRFIAASHLVARNLIKLGIDPDLIDVVYEFSTAHDRLLEAREPRKNPIFTVGGAGLVDWRKGPEFFLMVATHCKNHFPEMAIEFTWIGKVPEFERAVIEEDIRKAKLDNVSYVGQTENPESFFKEMDIFLMTSREDPFPLVCIEVGQSSVPIICFEGATGTEEVLVEGGGKIVPYMDIQAMANVIREYYQDRCKLALDGARACELFSKFTPAKICPQILQILEETRGAPTAVMQSVNFPICAN